MLNTQFLLNFVFFSVLFCISICVCKESSYNEPNLKHCLTSHRGVLRYHPKNDLNEIYSVSAVLNRDKLQLYRGLENFETINLRHIIAPLIIASTNAECLTMNIINKDTIELCCNPEECINYWWFLMTKQIMCLNQGEMRNESEDTFTLEEEQLRKLSGEIEDDITIHIKDEQGNIPQVLIKSE